jgi:ABC-type phosphate transport system permease subunit
MKELGRQRTGMAHATPAVRHAAPAVVNPTVSVGGSWVADVARPVAPAFVMPLAACLAGLVVAFATLLLNDAVAVAAPTAFLMAVAVMAPVSARARSVGHWDRAGVTLAVVCLSVAVILLVMPSYVYGWQINGVIHKSAFASPMLLVTATAGVSYSLRRLLGDTPGARDMSVYPVVAVPVLLALLAYGLLIGQVIVHGVGGLSLAVLTTPWGETGSATQAGGVTGYTVGLLNHILGTLLLMVLTCLFSLVPGVGAGVFMSEYPGRLANLIGFATTMLRAMSVFIIGVALIGFVSLFNNAGADSPVTQLIRGVYRLQGGGNTIAGGGSFLTASLFLSLLVIPIIAKLTEEGLRSVPVDIREGTVAIGATEGFGLRRVLLPWAAPNIVTGLLLGAAEAAGSLAIIMFIAGNGEHGVGPTSPVTSLDFALFATRYGTQSFIQSMGYRAPTDYAYTAALLLLVMTLGLTVVAMLIRSHFSRRFRGSLTIG